MKDKPDDKIVKLNFDTDRHDSKVEEAKQSEAELRLRPQQKRIKKKAYDIYQRWVKKVKAKARTPQEVIAATYELQTQLGALSNAANDCGMEEWHNFTMTICEDKISQLVSTGICAANQIVRFVPDHVTLLDKENDEIVRDQLRRAVLPITFRTLEELLAIPFVKTFSEKALFIGFCLDGNQLVATFKDGEVVKVGALVNGVAVEKFPTLQDFQAALQALTPTDNPPDSGGADGQ